VQIRTGRLDPIVVKLGNSRKYGEFKKKENYSFLCLTTSAVIIAAIGANAAIAVVVSNSILSNNTNNAMSPVYAPNA